MTRRRAIFPNERQEIAAIVANEIERVTTHVVANQVAMHRLLSVLSFSEPEYPTDDNRPRIIAEAVDSLFSRIPDEYLDSAINALTFELIRRVGPLNVDPLEGQCITPALLDTLDYIEKKCTSVRLSAKYGGGPAEQFKASFADEIMELLAGLR